MSKNNNPAQDAIEKLQGVATISRAIGPTRQSIHKWHTQGVPPKYLRAVAEVSGVSVDKLLAQIEERDGVDYKALVRSLMSEVKRAERRE